MPINVGGNAFELYILKVHVEEALLIGDGPRAAYRPGAMASADYELLSLLGAN
jgi:hypothetical protein